MSAKPEEERKAESPDTSHSERDAGQAGTPVPAAATPPPPRERRVAMSRLRDHLSIIITAAVVSTVFMAGPSVAQAAYDAVNADKVDGKHAVGAGATVDARKGKLVATSPTTGRLPNDIIAKAPNADKLDGRDSTVFFRDYEVVDGELVLIDSGLYGEAFVTCPGTKVVVSGGWTTQDGVPSIEVFRSSISGDGKTFTTSAQNVSPDDDRGYWAYAVCANV
jgi:hypothetical protein